MKAFLKIYFLCTFCWAGLLLKPQGVAAQKAPSLLTQALLVHSSQGPAILPQAPSDQRPSLLPLAQGRKVSLRGLSVVNDSVFWVSGSGGQVGRSTNGGKSIDWQVVPGMEKRDFRDIEALDENTALVLAVAEPGLILKTTNGGKHWETVFEDKAPGVFLDAFAFVKTPKGTQAWAIGDPLPEPKGKDTLYPLYALYSPDAGAHWEKKSTGIYLEKDEAFFASSGSNLVVLSSGKVLAATGGKAARLWQWQLNTGIPQQQVLPLLQGKSSKGANALAVSPSEKKLFVVGGDFKADSSRQENAIGASAKGKKWQLLAPPAVAPWGYRSGVVYVDEKNMVACGTSGVDFSSDGGKTWQNLGTTGYHVVKKSPSGRVVYLAGGNGRIARLSGF